ncbi:MAG: hypothetical protein L3J07_03220 [Candidatus Magasanikbacteria bacterium]|nr:hypothetical protein [Candidatus Magasanikbacteria bacterium]
MIIILAGCFLFFFERLIEFYKLNQKRVRLTENFFRFLFKDVTYYEKKKLESFEYFSKLQDSAENKTLKNISFINYRILETLYSRKLSQDSLLNKFKHRHKIIWSLRGVSLEIKGLEVLLQSLEKDDKDLEKLFSEFKKLLNKKTKRS